MGAAASIEGSRLHELPEGASLPTAKSVHSSLLEDKLRYLRKEEQLAREGFLKLLAREGDNLGYDNTAQYAKPLMQGKRYRHLRSLDDVKRAHSEDQVRSWGYSEVQVPALGPPGTATTSLCMLDAATVACASDTGPIWVYNWMECSMVSQMRDGSPDGYGANDQVGQSAFKGAARALCPASEDCSLLASGDDGGVVALWDLARPGLRSEAHIHEGAVTGIAWDEERAHLVSTSADTYVTVFDMEQQQVVERGVPKPLGCGSGVPNTVLALGSQGTVALVGGGDGKLRVWKRNDGPLQRQCTLLCQGAAPTQCRIAPDGWRVVVSTKPADKTLCGGEPGLGGVLLFDLRKMTSACGTESMALSVRGGSKEHPALLGYAEVPSSGPGIASGCLDFAFLESGEDSLAVCLTGVSAKAFDVTGIVTSDGLLAERFHVDIVAPQDGETLETFAARPCAIAALDRTVITATTAPFLDVWHAPEADEAADADDAEEEPPEEPLVLRSRACPCSQSGPPAFDLVKAALQKDKARLAALTE